MEPPQLDLLLFGVTPMPSAFPKIETRLDEVQVILNSPPPVLENSLREMVATFGFTDCESVSGPNDTAASEAKF